MRKMVKKAFVFAVALGSLTSAGYVSSYGDIIRMQCQEAGQGPTFQHRTCYCSSYNGYGINIVVKGFCPMSIKYNIKTNTWSK